MSKTFDPNFRTPTEAHNKTELVKRDSNGMRGELQAELHNQEADFSWEAEQLAKSYGIYLEFNRAKSGKDKDWMYMIRLSIPGGGPITPAQWALLDELGEAHTLDPHGRTSLRLTTRENIQFHWVDKAGTLDIVRRSAAAGLFSLNGCGDNVRNVMACPMSSHTGLYDSRELASRLADYFMLPQQAFVQIFAVDPNVLPEERESERFQYGPQLLNRKFKIAVGSVHRDPVSGEIYDDNCVEMRTHDLAVQPVVREGAFVGHQIWIGGGQGEKNGKPTAALMAQPLAFVTDEQLMPVVDAVVKVHQAWGDRENRHWARLKYLVRAKGIAWYREQVAAKLSFPLAEPVADLDPGPRHLHHGWMNQGDGKWSFGAFIENGRLTDASPNGRLKTMVRDLATRFETPLAITPNQDLVFFDIDADQRAAFDAALAEYGFGGKDGQPFSVLRMRSGACVGRDTCRLAYTESEQFEPELLDEMEARGWGDKHESIGITGCERQCFRPATKTIGLVGSGMNRYMLKLMGSEDGRYQGTPLIADEKIYLRSIPRDRVPDVLDFLFKTHEKEGHDGEDMGAFHRRIGVNGILERLAANADLADLLNKPIKSNVLTD